MTRASVNVLAPVAIHVPMHAGEAESMTEPRAMMPLAIMSTYLMILRIRVTSLLKLFRLSALVKAGLRTVRSAHCTQA